MKRGNYSKVLYVSNGVVYTRDGVAKLTKFVDMLGRLGLADGNVNYLISSSGQMRYLSVK